MTVGFFHIDRDQTEHRTLAAGLVRSVRRVMPTVEIVHFTDTHTRGFDGVDRVVRRGMGPIALECLEHYASVEGDWLFVDTDILIQRDVRHVFNESFDLAVATREGTLLDDEKNTKFWKRMPYNKGAVFSRSQPFWQEAVERARKYPAARKEWMGDQIAMNSVIASEEFNVKVLPKIYNYPPKEWNEDLKPYAILHYKGSRKKWMRERVRAA